MAAFAQAKYLRISPTKARVIIPLLKGKSTVEALQILKFTNKKASALFEKVIKSAVSNAAQKGIDKNLLYISRILVDGGPMYKRYKAAPFGRAVMIRRRTSHISIYLDAKGMPVNQDRHAKVAKKERIPKKR